MSRESVEFITGKIVLDAGFREVLPANPDKVLSEYELADCNSVETTFRLPDHTAR